MTSHARARQALLAATLAATALLTAGPAAAAADVIPNRYCEATFVDGGPFYAGVGITVATPGGAAMIVCRVAVPPPPETVVITWTDFPGNVVVVTRCGQAVLVFRGAVQP